MAKFNWKNKLIIPIIVALISSSIPTYIAYLTYAESRDSNNKLRADMQEELNVSNQRFNRSLETQQQQVKALQEQVKVLNKSAVISFKVLPNRTVEYIGSDNPIGSRWNPIRIASNEDPNLYVLLMNKGNAIAQIIRINITAVKDGTRISPMHFRDYTGFILGPQEYLRIPLTYFDSVTKYIDMDTGAFQLEFAIDYDEGTVKQTVFAEIYRAQ